MTAPAPAPAFVAGERVFLRPLSLTDANPEYLSWLNDPEVLRYRSPKAFPSRMEDLQGYLEHIAAAGDLHLAICLAGEGRHIGNLSISGIQWVHGHGDLAIMIGARGAWGRGLGREAIALAMRHAFHNMGLRRLSAASPNPRFNRAVASLGWVHEGTQRQAFLLDGRHVDIECWGLLKDEVAIPPAEG